MVIYKYKIPPEGEVVSYKLRCGQILSVKEVNGEICAYMTVDKRYREKTMYFMAVGTGWDMERILDRWEYLDTVVVGEYVWHIYFTAEWDRGKRSLS